MIDVEKTLIRLRDTKRQNNVVPDSVTYSELKNEMVALLRQELNELYGKGKISVNNTLNDKSINII